MYDKEIEKIIDKLSIFEKAFDNIRFVDPVQKRVVKLHDNEATNSTLQCFDFWGKNKVCDNCVSMRAYRDDQTYIKMEYSSNDIYIITAIPIQLEDRRVVLELLKNATNSLVLGSSENGKHSEIHAIIDSMNNLALKDSLTGIYNRRYINEKLPVDLANANISNDNLSVIMADIDFFKNVNDTYGHLTGDCTLKYFAELLSQALKREGDWVARYGGEEFLICLPGASHQFATEVAENMREIVENSVFRCDDNSIHITASFGVSSVIPKTQASIDSLIDGADKKLYEAKHNGRNRVEA